MSGHGEIQVMCGSQGKVVVAKPDVSRQIWNIEFRFGVCGCRLSEPVSLHIPSFVRREIDWNVHRLEHAGDTYYVYYSVKDSEWTFDSVIRIDSNNMASESLTRLTPEEYMFNGDVVTPL